jgi:hypothetical protein
MQGNPSRRRRAVPFIVVAIAAMGLVALIPQPASSQTHVHVVRTICPGGDIPSPNNSGCWCNVQTHDAAPAPADPSCRPTARTEGPYCLWSCGYPVPKATPAKAGVPKCHNGLGKPVPCIDFDSACASDGCAWSAPPGAGCDSPPGPAGCVSPDSSPAPAAPAAPDPSTATFVPPPSPGSIYVAVTFASGPRTRVAVAWGTWQHHDAIAAVPGAHGVILRLHHPGPDQVPLLVATDGTITAGPLQSDVPLKLPGYLQTGW